MFPPVVSLVLSECLGTKDQSSYRGIGEGPSPILERKNIVTRPHISQRNKRFSDNAVIWPAPGLDDTRLS